MIDLPAETYRLVCFLEEKKRRYSNALSGGNRWSAGATRVRRI